MHKSGMKEYPSTPGHKNPNTNTHKSVMPQGKPTSGGGADPKNFPSPRRAMKVS